MPLENSIPSGMTTIPSSVITTVSKTGGWGRGSNTTNDRANKVRVTAVNSSDGSILFELLTRNVGASYLGNPQNNKAYMSNNTVSSVPLVGEIVEIFSAPDISLSESKSQPTFKTYYKPAPIDIWQNQNNNVVLDNSVQGQVLEDPMNSISLTNYQKALNGFV
jgi:hypothetical protein